MPAYFLAILDLFKVRVQKARETWGLRSRKRAGSHGFSLMVGSWQGNFCAHLKTSLKSTELHRGRGLVHPGAMLLASQGNVPEVTLRRSEEISPQIHCCSLCLESFLFFNCFFSILKPHVFKPNESPRLPCKALDHSAALIGDSLQILSDLCS